MIPRREFITLLGGAAAAWPMAARGQQVGMPVVGYLDSTTRTPRASIVDAVRQGLRETGYVEGQNLAIEYRFAENHNDRLPTLAADLARRNVAVIIASAIRATLAAKEATSSIPIVFATANDPLQFNLVTSFNHPGGHITGVTWLTAALGEKRLALLHELLPAARTIALLVNPKNANAEANVKNAQEAAHILGLQTHVVNTASEDEFETALAYAAGHGAQALLVLNDPLFLDRHATFLPMVARHGLPAIYPSREMVEAGGLMSYGASIGDAHRQAAVYAGRILKGEKPADLPVLQPTKFELVLNLKSAKALGIDVPAKLLALVDEVIE